MVKGAPDRSRQEHPIAMEPGTKKPPNNERSRDDVLAAYERGVMILLFILAVAILALVTWLAVYLFSI